MRHSGKRMLQGSGWLIAALCGIFTFSSVPATAAPGEPEPSGITANIAQSGMDAFAAQDVEVGFVGVFNSDDGSDLNFIAPGYPFFFSYELVNNGTTPMTLTGFTSRMWSTINPAFEDATHPLDFCDQFLRSTPVARQTFGQVIAPGTTLSPLLDNVDYWLDFVSTPNECQGADFYWDGTPTFAAVPSSVVAAGTDHAAGEAGQLTATVTSDVAASGAVQFSIDGVPYGAPVVLVDGIAQLPVTGLAAGTHQVTAEFLPDPGGPAGSISEPASFSVTAPPLAPPGGPGTPGSADHGVDPGSRNTHSSLAVTGVDGTLGMAAAVGLLFLGVSLLRWFSPIAVSPRARTVSRRS